MVDQEQTQDPEGSGQGEQLDAAELTRLRALDTENEALKEQVKNIDVLARRQQARADRLQAAKPTPSPAASNQVATTLPPLAGGSAGAPNQATRVAQAEEDAYQAKLQTYKLQVMQHLGLTDDDVDPELELTSADAILNHMNLVSVQKQLGQSQSITMEDVNKAVADALTSVGGEGEGEPLAPGMGGLIDTGGPSGTLAGERSDKLDKMYKKAEELRRGGDLNNAGYLALRAVYADPDKIVAKAAKSDDLSDISV